MALGALFLMTGVMELGVPLIAEAFEGQLAAAGIPLMGVFRWVVPIVEIGAGLALLVGIVTRIVALVVIAVMAVAVYVHLVVNDPALFPLQPAEPVVPIAVMMMAAYLVWRGGGSASVDLRDVPPRG
jgi:uncharacterized membrane protein YphA (DoxX/SURF4 family)